MNQWIIVATVVISIMIIANISTITNSVNVVKTRPVPAPQLLQGRLHQLCVSNPNKFHHEVQILKNRGYLVIEGSDCNVTVIGYTP